MGSNILIYFPFQQNSSFLKPPIINYIHSAAYYSYLKIYKLHVTFSLYMYVQGYTTLRELHKNDHSMVVFCRDFCSCNCGRRWGKFGVIFYVLLILYRKIALDTRGITISPNLRHKTQYFGCCLIKFLSTRQAEKYV